MLSTSTVHHAWLLKETVVVIVHKTERNKVIRIISMRKATRNEQKISFQGFTN